jgi:putative restriction endonuclease
VVDLETERILLAAARVGQHVFARQVLANCGSRCVFCGLRPASFGATRMLLAGYIKPWKDSSPAERLDPRNGLAACPAHDVAFDTGMLTVNGGLRIHLARQFAGAIQTDPLARQYYGKPPLREVILLPEGARAPATKYLDWHRRGSQRHPRVQPLPVDSPGQATAAGDASPFSAATAATLVANPPCRTRCRSPARAGQR